MLPHPTAHPAPFSAVQVGEKECEGPSERSRQFLPANSQPFYPFAYPPHPSIPPVRLDSSPYLTPSTRLPHPTTILNALPPMFTLYPPLCSRPLAPMFVWPPHSCIESDAAIMSTTTTNPHQVFTCRDAWHFAVARDYPFARSTSSALTESRVADGTVIARRDHGKGTGWRRSLVTPHLRARHGRQSHEPCRILPLLFA